MFRVPPSAVAAVMFDVSQRPRWVGAVAAATLETPGLLREGSVIRQTVRMAGRQFNVRVRVADLDPGRKLVTTALLRVPQSEDVLEVAPHETGTLVTYSGAHQISLVYAILAGWRLPWMLKRLRAQRLADFERLQPLVERLGPSALAGSRP